MSSRSDRVSARAQRFWSRLQAWYGANALDQYGDGDIPDDWAALIDAHANDTVALALAEIRRAHVTFPPRLPQVDQIFRRVSSPKLVSRGPRPQDTLTEHVLRYVKLTPQQLRGPWHFFGRSFAAKNTKGELIEGHGREIVGVLIDADGDAPGHRILLADIQADQIAHAFDAPPAPAAIDTNFARHLPEVPDYGPRERTHGDRDG